MELITLTVLRLVIQFTCQMAYVTGSGRMSYCNQTLFLSGKVGSETREGLASFPGPTQLSVASSTESLISFSHVSDIMIERMVN